MGEAAILESVAEIIRKVLSRPNLPISAESQARAVPGWDSLAMVDIIIAVQDHFGVEFETEELDRLRNVGDLVRSIAIRRIAVAG